jgi:transcriptional regulator with XRE-family HTH domain
VPEDGRHGKPWHLIQSRAQFGYRGAVVPLLATLFTYLAFNVTDQVLTGPIAKHLSSIDISWIVGLIVSGGSTGCSRAPRTSATSSPAPPRRRTRAPARWSHEPPPTMTPEADPGQASGARTAAERGEVRFGSRLRRARLARRLSLADLAERSGVTASFLSRVERDETSPSVASLVMICEALGLAVGELFAAPQTTLVRRAQRAQLDQLPATDHVTDTLITPVTTHHLTVLETIAAPAGSGGEELYTTLTQTEVCFVLDGLVEVLVEEQRFVLEAGDALTFDGAAPHTWRNAGASGARILWILAPGLPDPQGETERTAQRGQQRPHAG